MSEFRIIELEARILAERALADDLADVLRLTIAGWDDRLNFPEADRVLARYRQARGR